MRMNLSQYVVRWMVAAACLGMTVGSATASPFTRGCAVRDLQVLMLIEDGESTNAISGEELRDAIFTMMHARIVCAEGRVADAMAIYDSIAQSVTPDSGKLGRWR